MEYIFNKIKLKKINNSLYISYNDYLLLNEKENNQFEYLFNNYINKGIINEKAKLDNYYDINFIFLLLIDNKDKIKDLFIFIKNNQLESYLWNYLYDYLNISLFSKNDFLNIIDNYKSILDINTRSYKESNYIHEIFYDDSPIFTSFLDIIKNIRDYYNLDDYGIENDYIKIYDMLNDNFDKCEEKSSEYLASYLLYSFVKEKPFNNHNEEIAGIIALYYLYSKDLLLDNNKLLITEGDISYAIAIANSSLDEKEAINRIKNIFSNKSIEINKTLELYNIFKSNPNEENLFNYIVSFIENNYFQQGYYDYYASKDNSCIKLHYNGEYYRLHLNTYKTFKDNNTLYFNGKAIANIEAPTIMGYRNEAIQNLYNEIKSRSYNDIINSIKKNINNNIKDYYNLNDFKINIKLDLEWSINIINDFD